MKEWVLVLTAALLGPPLRPGERSGQEPVQASEYQTKAHFLRNFLHPKYIEWPAQAFPEPGSPFQIGVLGEDPFGRHLDDAAAIANVGRKVEVLRDQDPAKLKACHIIFVASSEKDRLEEILKSLSDSRGVVVGDTPGFAERGVLINLFLDMVSERDKKTGESKVTPKLRFEINLDAVERAAGMKLQIHESLLSLARKVRDKR